MKNLGKKQKITLIVIGIAIVLVLLVGASYAYFQSMIDTGKKAPVDVITDTTDNLVFDIEDNINLAINKYNFGPGNGDLTSHAKATAKLRANSTDNTATYNYYLYFNIKSNEFVYTTKDHKPEIILTITDPSGNPVTSVTGLTYVTAGGVSGFDITTASGLFEIANNYSITSNSSTEDTLQEWNFTATFINLDSDQNDNTGKSMNGTIMFRRSGLDVSLKYVCDADVNLVDCIKNLNDDKNYNIVYHNGTILDENGNVIDANDGSYRYSGSQYYVLDKYKTSYDSVDCNYNSSKCIIKKMCNGIYKNMNDKCTLNSENNNMYYILNYDKLETHYSSYTEAVNKVINDGYAKATDNYVCFGSNEKNCSYDNLYRIIGVFGNKVKLVRAKMLSDLYAWNENGTYNWEGSSLELYLNNEFINTFNDEWKSLISESQWTVGGLSWNTGDAWETTKGMFDYELGTKRLKDGDSYIDSSTGETVIAEKTQYFGKIGLLYFSDLAYATFKKNWLDLDIWQSWIFGHTNGNSSDNDYANSDFWLLTKEYDLPEYVFISEEYEDHVTASHGVIPTFYLETFVKYESGDGTIENPIRIGA